MLSESHHEQFPVDDTQSLNIVMARHGYLGTSPVHPSLAISFHVLELLDSLIADCPQLSLQAFVKAVSRLHHVSYKFSFTIVYL